MSKYILEINDDIKKRIDEAQSVPDMMGCDIVNGLNAIKNAVPYEPDGNSDRSNHKKG